MTETCYYIEVVCDTAPSTNGLLRALENVFSNKTTWLPDQNQEATEVPERTDIDGNTIPAHVKQSKRLDWSEDRRAAVDGLVNALENNPKIEWYEIRTHKCHHSWKDGGVGTGSCSENVIAQDSSGNQVQTGTVPDGV